MFEQSVEAMGVEETLDAVESWTREQTQRQIRVFVAAAHFADLHGPETVRVRRGGDGRVLPGTERAVRLGGVGTPRVGEFAAASFGARMGRTSYAARMLIADALDLRHRLPRLWARVTSGEVPVGYARHVACQTRDLSVEAATWVDSEVAGYADGRLCWSRFEALVAGKVVDADPDAAAAGERDAAGEEFAKVSRSSEHGQKTLYVRSAAAAMVRIDATIAYLADALAALGDADTLDVRRAKAVLVMANPTQAIQLLAAFAAHRRTTTDTTTTDTAHEAGEAGEAGEEELSFPDGSDTDEAEDIDGETGEPGDTGSDDTGPTGRFFAPFRPNDHRWPLGFDPRDLLPSVTLYLHLYTRIDGAADRGDDGDGAADADRTGGVVRWEGDGPVSRHYLTEVLAPAAHLVVKPVLDAAGMAPVDAYEIPDRHREAVHLRTPADVFPYASATTSRDGRTAQLDHTRRYRPPTAGGPPGQTGLDNLGPLTRFHHRIKTHGDWQLKQPFPGLYIWRDPHGRLYLVDHTGTRPLGHSPPTDVEQPDITLHVHPPPDDVVIEYTGPRHRVA